MEALTTRAQWRTAVTSDPSLTPADLARRWGVSAKTVIRLADEGQLQGTRIGTRWRFSPAQVAAYEERQAAPRAAIKSAS
jgi:excisionase family DNA binding protein